MFETCPESFNHAMGTFAFLGQGHEYRVQDDQRKIRNGRHDSLVPGILQVAVLSGYSCELGHNTRACVPSRMIPPNRPLFWIITSMRRRASTRPALAYDAHYAVGRPARTTAGPVPAAMSGTRSTREDCAQHASTSGIQPSVSLVPAGRHIPTGMHSEA